jgi:heme exporter protein B
MWAIIWKDVLLEVRRRETVMSLFVLGVLVLLVFQLAVDVDEETSAALAPGLLWVAIVFAGMIGLGRIFLIERENSAMTGLLMAPVDRGSLFLAKLGVNLAVMLTFEVLLLPVFFAFFGLPLGAAALGFGAVLLAGTLGLAATGTLFALAAMGTRARELMLPLMVLPLEVPLVLAAVQCTEAVLGGAGLGELGAWGNLLLGFDVLFVTLGWMTFEFLTVD